jgi:UDP-N-acetylglucosamine transferase subunit ALG13
MTKINIDQPVTDKPLRKPRILICPLDWGLGHAARCIPVIRELLSQGFEVWLAGEGAQEVLLKSEFPELPFLPLQGYRISYAKTARGLIWKMIQQGPKMQRAIQSEQHWLKKIVKEHHFDAVISDNRYGLYHTSIPCIFITHQLSIKSSLGKWTKKILQKRNYNFINRFTECWVPDLSSDEAGVKEPAYSTGRENYLAGELSHPQIKPSIPVRYIGLLSRFERKDIPEKKTHLLIILSGPEPQRSILEEKIIADVSHYNYTATVVRGLPGSSSLIPSTGMIKFYNHLPAVELNAAMQEAEYVISRSGYSSVMDIVTLQKKSILIPTPGQTEQEYLGEYLMKKGIAVTVQQNNFSLTTALASAADYNYTFPAITDNNSMLKKTVSDFWDQLNNSSLGKLKK